MSLATKNVATVLVGSVLVLALSFAFVTPAKADLLSDLQAQVQALLAQIAALGGGSTTTGGSCTTFTADFQQGSSGAEVIAIQKFLNSHGAQVAVTGAGSPGNETSYFGAMTKAAVAKFQAANGITPAAGYWGPITRAKANSMCMGTTPTTPTTPGGETLNGSAGSIVVNETSADVEEDVVTGGTEKVLGFHVQASGSDVRVTNVRVKFTHSVNSGSPSDRLSNYASEISIWAGGQKIAAMSPSSFVRDSSGVYSASIPVSQVVRMNSNNKVTFHVGFTANTSIDSDDLGGRWEAELVQVRYTDPSGATLFETPAANSIENANILVERLGTSGDVKLRMAEGSGNPKAGNVEVNDSGSTDVTLLEFTLKAEGAAMEFDSLKASTTASGIDEMDDMVQEFYLMRGSTQLAEVSGATSGISQALTFSLDDTEEISADSTQTYRIVAKLASIAETTGTGTTFDQGDTLSASTSVSVWNINAKTSVDGKSVDSSSRTGSVTNYVQTFYSEGIKVTKVGENVSITNSDTPANSIGTYKMTVRVTAFGSEDVYLPLSATATSTAPQGALSLTTGATFSMLRGTDGAATSTGASGTLARVSGGSIVACGAVDCVKIGGGSSADLELTVSFNPQVGEAAGQWRAQLWAIGHSDDEAADAAAELQVATTPVEDFRTGFATINN